MIAKNLHARMGVLAISTRAHIPPLSLRSRTIRGLNKGHRGVEVRHSQNGYALLQLTPSMRVGDKYVAGGSPIAIEGAAPDNRVVILQFESIDKLKAWWDSSRGNMLSRRVRDFR
jgi:uncharacterized protein (DUF1330 family)